MALKITAKVYGISETDTVTVKGTDYQKRSILVYQKRFNPETGEPEMSDDLLLFEFFGNSVSELDKCKKDDIVQISFSLRGGKYTDQSTGKERVTTRINPYKIEIVETSNNKVEAPTPQNFGGEAPLPPPPQDNFGLPF